MSKSTAITIIVVVLLAISGGLAWWYFSLGQSGVGNQNNDSGGINFFPFGNNNEPTTNDQQLTTDKENQTENAPEIREVSRLPVAGFLPLVDNLGFPFVRYVDQETGNLYDAPLEIVSKKRISNTTIPKIREVHWLSGGNSFIMRYLDEKDSLQSFYATLKENSSAEGSLTGRFLLENISDLSLFRTNSASTKIFYYLTENSVATMFSAESDGSKATHVYSSPMKDWLLYGINDSLAYIQTKSSGLAPSFVFSLNIKNGTANPTLSNFIGLSILPNKKGDLILYSSTPFEYPLLYIYDVNKKTSTQTSLRTFADKCRWSESNVSRIICAVPTNIPRGTYPDDWYKGTISFSDNIWEIDSVSGTAKELVSLYKNSFFFDISSFSLSDKDKFLILQDKTNNSLWSVRLKQ
ncbi:MAG: hypothetical protein AAB513_01920 [Patescibacteria group bacterium]